MLLDSALRKLSFFGKPFRISFIVCVVSDTLCKSPPVFAVGIDVPFILFATGDFSKTVQKGVPADRLAEVADSVPVGLTESHGTPGGHAGFLPGLSAPARLSGQTIKTAARYAIANYFLFLCMQKCPERLPAGSVRRMKRECSENLQQYPLL